MLENALQQINKLKEEIKTSQEDPNANLITESPDSNEEEISNEQAIAEKSETENVESNDTGEPEVSADELDDEDEEEVKGYNDQNLIKTLRKDRKALKRQLQGLRIELARKEGALNQTQAQKPIVQEAPVNADPEPDKNAYYEDWLEWNLRDQKRQISSIAKEAEMTKQQTMIAQAHQELRQMEQQYASSQKVSDYQDRIDFIMESEKRRLKFLNRDNASVTDDQIDSYLQNEKLKLASQAYQKGQNPAKMFVELSEVMGYHPKIKAKETISSNTPKKINVARVNDNMRKNQNLIGQPSTETGNRITPEMLKNYTKEDLMRDPTILKRMIKEVQKQERGY